MFNVSSAQVIEMKLNLLGYKFIKNDKKISWNELVEATNKNKEANHLIKKAKTHNTISNISALVGGVLTGIPIGQSITEGDPNWTLAYIGGGIFAISIPFTLSALNKANKGVDEYNQSLKPTASTYLQPSFDLIVNGNGLGLSVQF